MTAKEQITVNNIIEILYGEIDRMCLTADLSEFDTMYDHAMKHLHKMARIIYDAKFATHHGMGGAK